MGEHVDQLGRRLDDLLASLGLVGEFEPRGSAPSGSLGGGGPTWLSLPLELHRSWRKDGAQSPAPEAFAELLWSQYALFLHVRLLDDLLDGHRQDLRLTLLADHFLLESLEGLGAVATLDSAAFRRFHRDRLRETLRAALEVGRLESIRGRLTRDHLPLHAEVNAIFKVASAGVCHLHGRAEEAGWIFRLQDRIAVFGQVWDDFEDLWADLAEDRFTWVGNTVLDGWNGPGGRTGRGVAEWTLLDPLAIRPVIEELTRIAEAACGELPPDAPAPLRKLAEDLRARTDALDVLLHQARLRTVFGEEALARAQCVPASANPDAPHGRGMR